MAKIKTTIFERGDTIYLVSPVSPISPTSEEIEELAFAKDLMEQAPNPKIKWLRGEYVSADTPNRNGQVWQADDIAIKSLQPTFMPVTIMHDVRTSVGLIADTRLLTPEKDNVPKAKIDDTLAIWAHRYPEVAEEIDYNYEQGSLMQSMECHSPGYSCMECGQTFMKLARGAERANWCDHLSGGGANPARILRGVVFTGTGLIFGTRGIEGANPNGALEVFQDEVAEFHEKAHRETGRTGSKRSDRPKRRRTYMDPIEISREEYASLQKRPSAEEFAAEKQRADEATEKVGDLTTKLETAETAQKKAEDDLKEKEGKLKEAEEEKAAVELKSERIGKLGDGFMHKLGEQTKKNLGEQASEMKDDAWEGRLSELEELAGVKRDAKLQKGNGNGGSGNDAADTGKTAPEKKEDEFSSEELASTVVLNDDGSEQASTGGGSGGSGEPSMSERASVARGLLGKKKTTEKTD